MASLSDVLELLEIIVDDPSISKNIRSVLREIKAELENCEGDPAIKIDAALQRIEDLGLDPNLPIYARTQIWNLTSLLEAAKN